MRSIVIVPADVPPGSIMTCSRCGHKWAIRKRGDLPKNCPKCRSTLWMKNYHVYTCYRCQHSWGTANEEPLRCPKCHTSKWNVPVVQHVAKEDVVTCKLDADVKKKIYAEYDGGKGVFSIAKELDIAFGDVMDALCERSPGTEVKM